MRGTDDAEVNRDNMTGGNEKVQNIQEKYEHEKDVNSEEGLCRLRGGGWQTQYAQSYSDFDCGGIGTTSAEEEWGAIMPHQDTITLFDIKDWTWILNRVKNWNYNWVFSAREGRVILVVPGYVVCDRGIIKDTTDTDHGVRVDTNYGNIDVIRAVRRSDSSLASSDNNHINNLCIMSSGEIEATILQLFSWDSQTCEELFLCDQPDIVRVRSLNNNNSASDGIDDYVDHAIGDDVDGYNNVFASSRDEAMIFISDTASSTLTYGYWGDTATSIDEGRRTQNRGMDDYGEREGNGTMRYGVDIALKRKFDNIANTVCTETRLDRAIFDDDIRRGYHEGISGIGITLVDGEHVPNLNRDGSNNIPMHGFGSMGGIMDYTYFDESSVNSKKSNDECIWCSNMMNINAEGSSISQDTGDNVSTTMRDDNAYTHTGDTIYDTLNDSEKGSIGQGKDANSLEGMEINQQLMLAEKQMEIRSRVQGIEVNYVER